MGDATFGVDGCRSTILVCYSGRFCAGSAGFTERRWREDSEWRRTRSFHIDTWGVVPLAVCDVPPLWELKEEKFMDSAALFSGRSDPYHRTLTRLDKLFLVDVYASYQPLPKGDPKGEYHPPSFAGWFTVFDGDGNLVKKRRSFRAADFRLTPAARCPDAPSGRTVIRKPTCVHGVAVSVIADP